MRSTVPVGGGGRQRVDEVADRERPVRGAAPRKLTTLPRGDAGELVAPLERDQVAALPHRAQQPQRQGAGADAGLDDGRAGEDVAEGEDLRGILRVDDRRAARHRHDEVRQQRPHREVLVAVAAVHDAGIRARR